jgi:ABC-type multidrug transport system fused ATPase/permease subunit
MSGIFQALSYAILYGTLVLICYYGAVKNLISPGYLVQFLFLLLSVIANVVMLALNLGPLFQVYAASDRIKELIDVPTSQKGSFKPSGEI